MEVFADNLRFALAVAIATQRDIEQKRGYTSDSAMVAGWEQVLTAIENGEREIWLKDTPQ